MRLLSVSSPARQSAACCARPLTLHSGWRAFIFSTARADARAAEVVYLRQRAQPHDVGQNFRRARKLLRPDEVAVGLVDYEKRLWVALRRGVELRAGNQRAGRVAGVAEPDGGSARALRLRERKYVPRPRAVAVERFFVFAVDGLEDEIFARRRVGRDYVDGFVGAARNQYVLRRHAELARERLAQREAVAVGVVLERGAQVGDEAAALRHGVGVGAEVVNFRGRRKARGGVELFGVRPVRAEFHYFFYLIAKIRTAHIATEMLRM